MPPDFRRFSYTPTIREKRYKGIDIAASRVCKHYTRIPAFHIKELHRTLKNGTSDSRLSWFAVGGYKKAANEAGGQPTTPPGQVATAMGKLIGEYNRTPDKTLDELLDFHAAFERIHPFQDGNGRVGRLILFKECLRCGIVPFIIDDRHKAFYYRGLRQWPKTPGYLRDTYLHMQDDFKAALQYFGIMWDNEKG